MQEGAAKKKSTGKKVIIIFSVLILILILIAGGRILYQQLNPEETPSDEAVNVFVTKASHADISVSSVYTGQVSSESQVNVVPMIPGQVISVDVSLGEKVKKGDVLFKVDPQSVESQQAQAKIQYDGAKKGRALAEKSLDDAKKAAKDANKSVKKAKKALKQAEEAADSLPPGTPTPGTPTPGTPTPGTGTGNDPASLATAAVQQAEAAVQQAEAMKKQLDAAVVQAEAGYNQAATQYKLAGEGVRAAGQAVDNCTVTAPVAGVITTLTAQKGEMVSQAMPAVVITCTDELIISTSIAEGFVGRIHEGAPAEVYIKAVTSGAFKGVVKTVVPSPNMGQTTYPVEISLKGNTEDIKPGMFAEIYLVSESAKDVLTVPSDAVLIKSGKQSLAVLTADNKVVFKEIETGLDNGELVEIRSGITEGDTVIYEGQHYVSEDSTVRIMEDK